MNAVPPLILKLMLGIMRFGPLVGGFWPKWRLKSNMLRRLHDEKTAMVIPTKTDPIEQALLTIRLSGRTGRNLARALKKLKEGKLNQTSHKVGVMAAILSLRDVEIKKTLLGYWVDQIDAKLV